MTVFGVHEPICIYYFNAAILTMIWDSVFYILVHVFYSMYIKSITTLTSLPNSFFDAVDCFFGVWFMFDYSLL